MTTFVEEKNNNTTTTLSVLSDLQFDELNQDIIKLSSDLSEANSKNTAYLELNKQYLENIKKIEELSKQCITTRDLIDKIHNLEISKPIKYLLAQKKIFTDEIEKRSRAIEKYSDNRGFILTKDERKQLSNIDFQLEPLTKLYTEYVQKKIKNNDIKRIIEDLQTQSRPLAAQLNKQEKENKTLLANIETIKTNLIYLQTFQKNQLILKKCMALISERYIFIDENDDDYGYEYIKDKCILDYTDTLQYHGTMKPLCVNEKCKGVNIGYACLCGENKNIWFTLDKPKSHKNYITVEDTILFPDFKERLGYLVTRDHSIDEYKKYANEHNIFYCNNTDLFIAVNTHHHDMLRSTYCVPCEEYPHIYYNHDSDDECDEDCYFDINSEYKYCNCGNKKLIWDDDLFDPMNHSLLYTKPKGTLRYK